MRKIAVRAIIAEGNKLLLAKLKPYNGGPRYDFYCTIGGGLDENEGLVEGLKREVLEETGINAIVGRLLFVHQYKDTNDNIEFFFLIENAEDFKNIDLSQSTHGESEIEEIGFFDPKEINVLPKFLSEIEVEKFMSEPQVKIFDYFSKEQL